MRFDSGDGMNSTILAIIGRDCLMEVEGCGRGRDVLGGAL